MQICNVKCLTVLCKIIFSRSVIKIDLIDWITAVIHRAVKHAYKTTYPIVWQT